jgi:hypothetical protein
VLAESIIDSIPRQSVYLPETGSVPDTAKPNPALATKALQTIVWAEKIASENTELQKKIETLESETRSNFWLGYTAGLLEGHGAIGIVTNQVTRELVVEGHSVPSPASLEKADELSNGIYRGARDAFDRAVNNRGGKLIGIRRRFKLDSDELKAQIREKLAVQNLPTNTS